ncbi:uncharacterized protein KY384_001759 [Bacidia gigantensis]|uniref:uncharacterized protein n=1 Tax=Bacidia gigantensis TaxID=2732470 RepID=UPI001D049A7A|nr:uncharacterized protein KY384_001759 [Bacidia gigantensis]KAG8532977.1 hypothetical protein KY384_001759 [Bacidia gigantensis]
MDLADQGNIAASLLNVPFGQRWELLRPVIERLYVEEGRKLPEILTRVKDQYGFSAAQSQYKYQIKKWKLKKNTPAMKKEAMFRVVKARAKEGKSSVLTRGGENIDTKNFVRYFKSQTRNELRLRPAAHKEHADLQWTSVHFNHQFGDRM